MTIRTYVNSLERGDRDSILSAMKTIVELGGLEQIQPLQRRLSAVKRRLARINGHRDEIGKRVRKLREALNVFEKSRPKDPEARIFREMLRSRIKQMEMLLNQLYPKEELKAKVILSGALDTAEEQGALCSKMLRFIQDGNC